MEKKTRSKYFENRNVQGLVLRLVNKLHLPPQQKPLLWTNDKIRTIIRFTTGKQIYNHLNLEGLNDTCRQNV